MKAAPFSSKRDVSRRQILRGAGTVAVALPLLPEFVRPARAALGPKRVVSFFFGNGMPMEFSAGGVENKVLKPLAPHAQKLVIARGIRNAEASRGTGHQHAKGAATFATGRANPSKAVKGGPSLDYAAFEAFKPDTPIDSLAASLWWWSEDPVRGIHSWRRITSGSSSQIIPNPGYRRPLELFHRVFGGGEMMNQGTTPEAKRARRYEMSVLDSVRKSYEAIASPSSGYGDSVRVTVNSHLEMVRDIEKRAIEFDRASSQGGGLQVCNAKPAEPPDITPQQICTGGCNTAGANGGHQPGGGVSNESNWGKVWPLLVDIFVAAMRCGVTNHGALVSAASGDRYRFGPGNVHDLAHRWRAENENGFDEGVIDNMQRFAYFLAKMDDPSFQLVVNVVTQRPLGLGIAQHSLHLRAQARPLKRTRLGCGDERLVGYRVPKQQRETIGHRRRFQLASRRLFQPIEELRRLEHGPHQQANRIREWLLFFMNQREKCEISLCFSVGDVSAEEASPKVIDHLPRAGAIQAAAERA
jgi:hypothetical protein